MEGVLREIRTNYSELGIVVGGQAFLYGADEVLEKFPDVRYISSLHELETTVSQSKENGVS
jgi:hypothetical protein